MLDMRNYLAARERPPGPPVMHQRWERLLFLHWAGLAARARVNG
jgi:hypothetical protein